MKSPLNIENPKAQAGIFGTIGRTATLVLLTAAPGYGQQGTTPWEIALANLLAFFTGPLAKGLSLIAIVIGGLTLAYSEGGSSKRHFAGLVAGVGMAVSAASFLAWLFGL